MSIVASKTFKTYSLGCRVNQAEMEAISQQLAGRGYTVGKTKDQPELVLLNTCVVTQKAEFETRKEIRKLRRLYPNSFLVVLGCAATAKEKFNIALPEADLLVSNKEKQRVVETRLIASLQNKYILSGRKFIKIQEGCDRFCTFCLTASLRGKPTSVSPESIIKEINYWVNRGIKEIILTGVNIALYQPSMADLLKMILEKTAVERITLSSIYPEMLTEKFLSLVIANSRISRYFHLSIQSGSPTVLGRMKRKESLTRLNEQFYYLKKKIPQFTFRADFIVGFPDETEKEFQETLNFIIDNKISFVHVFPFSKRQGTVAFEMIKGKIWQDLPPQTKKERVKKVMKAAKEVRKDEANKLIAELLNCLIVRKRKDDWEGIAENGWPIKIRIMNNELRTMKLKGQIVPVKITAFENDQLLGEITSLPR